ncbi:isoprenoid biosynthesis glyoxalase ElbB [Pseudidiomarina sp. 1APP75-32.1]|uniref:Glyoxalase n=1 Tax=Pseudidiomarina terrestris TaxID=2820060 RepID=A0AAW7QY36_9GAMM|nr:MULTISPECIES: isoprenoid biosynthesis glyoxalase ElbB [unclassified Pseudidiomarina]MDN7123954.1 isoprenoid biosynthesis glyoxalase ElbB [Pseudidiomarina sp. 1APP75-32.1]MDN7127708.1 isoprenoid biosynthesis glyoxalase ElbB [Pseudidiomarina sp. 1APR75-33.1]MDN7130454.1 isoprenoid biosynthesis glyoxalase ElbB [Pseudidiomarina sp. 1APR75-15]MEA3588831.1 isoprenoid biosynthesis glyoxalase ElbB [Pseudidiomarina sp. 1APP75-27a]
MKKVAVLLSGSGVFDGAEINEAVLTLLHISKNGADYQCFAPDMEQIQVVNHLNGEQTGEKRNVLAEAARIARSEVKPLSELDAAEFDALILPGGFGVAKNFCDFAENGADMRVNGEVLAIGKAFAEANKPAGYLCIAPVLLPHIYGEGVRVTVGNDKEVANAIEKMGGIHVECPVDDIVADDSRRLVTTPAYMLAENLVDAEKGISKLVEKVLYMAT